MPHQPARHWPGPSQNPELQSTESSRQGPWECGTKGPRAQSGVLLWPTQPEQLAIPGTRPCPPACPEFWGQGSELQVQWGRAIWGKRERICAERPKQQMRKILPSLCQLLSINTGPHLIQTLAATICHILSESQDLAMDDNRNDNTSNGRVFTPARPTHSISHSLLGHCKEDTAISL